MTKKIEETSFVKAELAYRVNPIVTNNELNELFADAWGNGEPTDFQPILARSLAFVCAYQNARLIGFVNVAWDGGVHAFVLDTTVHTEFQRRGIGVKLVEKATAIAKEHGVEWLHVDFEPHLQIFYDKCGFRKTNAGLIDLRQENIVEPLSRENAED